MTIFKNKVKLEDKAILDEYLKGYRYDTSGLSFSSLYMWRDINDFSWEIIGDYLCVVGMSHLELEEGIILPFMEFPMTKTGSYDIDKLRETVLAAKEKIEEAGYPFSIRLVPKELVPLLEEAFPDQLEIEDDRPNYDYVYERESLIELKGRELHKKKNHLNYFVKNYQFEYKELTEDMSDMVMEFIKAFNAKKDIPAHEWELLMMEEKAMQDVFENLQEAELLAGAIIIDGKIEAVSVGGVLNEDTVSVHIEKANTEYRGLYQMINREFCKRMPEHIKYVNREEDMGLPGLRKAKLSYKPVRLVEKYIVTFK
ncbi:MAG: phosphatidylglycerol lysyltransferase domain-containing protein [Eubacterium sp.]|nr:phosphatidylglycerol lysyltransferase domain-containing protein [Eubacterium sp.]